MKVKGGDEIQKTASFRKAGKINQKKGGDKEAKLRLGLVYGVDLSINYIWEK